jgi:antitoxin component of MazEF toxin-antitoxin module
MIKKLTKTGNSMDRLVLDRPLLEATGIEADTPVEVSTDGDVIVITPRRNPDRVAKLQASTDEIHRHFGGVFRRLAE